MKKPLIGITLGDPAGIGPEIAVQASTDPELRQICLPLIIGDGRIVEKARTVTGLNRWSLRPAGDPAAADWSPGIINLIDLRNMPPDRFRPGEIDAGCGKAAYEYIIKAADLALSGAIAAMVTGPIHKEAIHRAGIQEAGHAEILANHTRTKEFGAMLVDGNLRVVHVSTHVSLQQAIALVTKERVLSMIRLSDQSLRQLGFARPRIAVSGLNPHSGEGGLFGQEEIREICPAIEAARAEGINVEGPIPGDTVFAKGRGGIYDLVIAMYHDQGHIPIKGSFSLKSGKSGVSGVNITIGLPIIRTSVDHGTAFDIAWKGLADPASLIEAVKLAVYFAAPRSKAHG
jgi:4-hydroxythreonine-4-phosphate dehydrogenase